MTKASSNMKFEVLDKVFNKALDSSTNSISPADLQECFQGFPKVFQNDLQGAVLNMLSKTQNNAIRSFEKITDEYHVETELRGSVKKVDIKDAKSAAPEFSVEKSEKQLLIGLKRKELEELNKGMKMLEAEVKKQRDIADRLKAQLRNEMQALHEEQTKFTEAADKCHDNGHADAMAI